MSLEDLALGQKAVGTHPHTMLQGQPLRSRNSVSQSGSSSPTCNSKLVLQPKLLVFQAELIGVRLADKSNSKL